MIVDIQIDVSDVANEFILSTKEIESLQSFVVHEITAGFAKRWQEQAFDSLKSSRAEYMRSIKVVDKGKYEGEVRLVGVLSNMIESGCPAFDMKEGMLKSQKAKTSSEGYRYITIPFRFAASTSLGESSTFSGKMPPEIHTSAKALEVGQSLKKSDIPEQYKAPSTRKEITAESRTFKAYEHKSSIYEGITKTGAGSQSSYTGFRVVSENPEGSDPDSWIHSGIQAHNLAEKALESYNDIISDEITYATDYFLETRK